MLKVGLIISVIILSISNICAQIPILVNNDSLVSPITSVDGLTSFNGVLCFSAVQDYKRQLFRSDGTVAGTYILKEVICYNNCSSWGGSDPRDLIVINDLMYFFQYDSTNTNRKLWVTDGTSEGTRIVKQFNTSYLYTIYSKIEFSNKLFFVIQTDDLGIELWKSDGTEQGTTVVKDIFPGSFGSSPNNLKVFKNELYFFAEGGLWKTDGNESGTVLVKSGLTNSDGYRGSTTLHDELYFSANDGYLGAELWKTDGTGNGTVMVRDINPGVNSSRPSNFQNYFDTVYFSAADTSYEYGINITEYNTELYRSDGTYEGTYLVKDINMDNENGSNVSNIMRFGDKLLFTAVDNNYYIVPNRFGCEIYETYGAEGNTNIFKDINPGYESSNPDEFLIIPGAVYFRATNFVNNYELWYTDGTSGNTEMVYDIKPGVYGSYPKSLTLVDSNLFFTTDSGAKLWKLEGVIEYNPDTTGISESIINENSIYPIPFKDYINIKISDAKNISVIVNLYTIVGQKVLSREIKYYDYLTLDNLDLLQSGVYILELKYSNKKTRHKIIKQ